LCQAIRQNKHVQLLTLHLSNNKIAIEGAKILRQLLEDNDCTIRTLDLGWNDLKTDGAVAMAEAIKKTKSLTSLSLNANSISDAGGQMLAHSLLENQSIQVLSLQQNNIGGGSCFVFSRTCPKHPSIGKLDLSSNPVGEAGARSIYRQIMRGLRCFIYMQSCSYFPDEKIFDYTMPSLAR
jgi:Ran GTPase-activating protein (RanGAP) involved in mRNA processing and transport